MARISAYRISFVIGDVGNKSTIFMHAGEERYVLLTVKQNPMAVSLIESIAEIFNVEAIVGMAFEFPGRESTKLITHPEPSATGVYVKEADFEKVTALFQK